MGGIITGVITTMVAAWPTGVIWNGLRTQDENSLDWRNRLSPLVLKKRETALV